MRAITAFLAALLLILAATSSVSAAKPVGSCPAAFTPATYEELNLAFPHLEDAVGADALMGLFDSVDANNNDRVCWIPHPPQSTSYGPPRNYAVNIVDDVSAAH